MKEKSISVSITSKKAQKAPPVIAATAWRSILLNKKAYFTKAPLEAFGKIDSR